MICAESTLYVTHNITKQFVAVHQATLEIRILNVQVSLIQNGRFDYFSPFYGIFIKYMFDFSFKSTYT